MKTAKKIIHHATYDVGDEFFIDITENNGPDKTYEAWMWNEQYGVKSLMFGIRKSDYSLDEFTEIVEKNVRQHKRIYRNLYMDEELT